jgi:molybdate transport system regulatory protein
VAMLWTICGAGRGVGKTHLALGLCEILPDATHVKLGRGHHNASKPAALVATEQELDAFIEEHSAGCRHIVAEANSLAREGRGDLIIFLDAPLGHEDPREDREILCAKSHIGVSPRSDARNWKSVLRARLADAELAEKAFRLILDQHRFLFGTGISVRSRIWFLAGGERVFGSGLARLLDGIERLGSLSDAAKAAKISYRQAWDLIKEAETGLGKRLVIPHAGGAGGGGSALTEDGRRLLEVFNTLSREVADFADARFTELSQGSTHGSL